jgi:hypothetical protein
MVVGGSTNSSFTKLISPDLPGLDAMISGGHAPLSGWLGENLRFDVLTKLMVERLP